MKPETPKTICIQCERTGEIFRGLIAERHYDGSTTIFISNLKRRGREISFQDILEVERDTPAHEKGESND